MKDYQSESPSHDPIHGYIPFTSGANATKVKSLSGEIIDHACELQMYDCKRCRCAERA